MSASTQHSLSAYQVYYLNIPRSSRKNFMKMRLSREPICQEGIRGADCVGCGSVAGDSLSKRGTNRASRIQRRSALFCSRYAQCCYSVSGWLRLFVFLASFEAIFGAFRAASPTMGVTTPSPCTNYSRQTAHWAAHRSWPNPCSASSCS